MAISQSLFELEPDTIEDADELAKKLGQALVDTMEVETPEDTENFCDLWQLLAAYKSGVITGDHFIEEVRRRFINPFPTLSAN